MTFEEAHADFLWKIELGKRTAEEGVDAVIAGGVHHDNRQTLERWHDTWLHFTDLGVETPDSLATLMVHYHLPGLEPSDSNPTMST